jgi:hypothetical protein
MMLPFVFHTPRLPALCSAKTGTPGIEFDPDDRELNPGLTRDGSKKKSSGGKKQKRENDTPNFEGLKIFPVRWYGERVYCI